MEGREEAAHLWDDVLHLEYLKRKKETTKSQLVNICMTPSRFGHTLTLVTTKNELSINQMCFYRGLSNQ